MSLGVVLPRRLGRAARRRRRPALADRLAIVEADHHHDELRLVRRDRLAHDLRPLDVAPRIVANEARERAVLAHDAEFGPLGEGVFQSVGEPVGHRIAQHQDRRVDRRRRFRRPARGRRRRRGVRLGLLLLWPPVTRAGAEEAAERIVLLRCCCGARCGGREPPPNGFQNCAAAGTSSATLMNAAADALARAPTVVRELEACQGHQAHLEAPSIGPILRQKCQLEDDRVVTLKGRN